MTAIDSILEKVEEEQRKTQAIQLPRDDFKPIPMVLSDRRVLFVDGGNGTLLETPHYCVSFVRLYAVVYQSKKRVSQVKEEFYAYVSTKRSADGLFVYVVSFFSDTDASLTDQKFSFIVEEKMLPSDIVEIVRKVCELRLAKECLSDLRDGDLVVLDGDLEAEHPHEQRAVEDLFQATRMKNLLLAGLSKTSRLLSKEGVSLIALLHDHAPTGLWYYSLNNRIFFVRLHEKSHYVFRLDTAKPGEVTSALLAVSSDPSFLGYPYGLIEADARARVSKKEVEQLRLIFLSKMKKGVDLTALNAHSVLDKMSV